MESQEIKLPSGAIATKRRLTGRHLAQYRGMAQKSISDATTWLVVQAFDIGGKQLTVDQFEDLDAEDAVILLAEVDKIFLAYQHLKS